MSGLTEPLRNPVRAPRSSAVMGGPLPGPRRFAPSLSHVAYWNKNCGSLQDRSRLKVGRLPRMRLDHAGLGRRLSGGQRDGQDASSSTGKSGSTRSMSASCGFDARGRMPRLGLPCGMRQPG